MSYYNTDFFNARLRHSSQKSWVLEVNVTPNIVSHYAPVHAARQWTGSARLSYTKAVHTCYLMIAKETLSALALSRPTVLSIIQWACDTSSRAMATKPRSQRQCMESWVSIQFALSYEKYGMNHGININGKYICTVRLMSSKYSVNMKYFRRGILFPNKNWAVYHHPCPSQKGI